MKSLFAKYLAVFPKGTTAELRNARIVVAHAQDIDGSPFANEVVLLLEHERERAHPGVHARGTNNLAKKVGPYNLAGQRRGDDPFNQSSHKRVCIRTND